MKCILITGNAVKKSQTNKLCINQRKIQNKVKTLIKHLIKNKNEQV